MNGSEPALEPDRAIIDPHLHLWEILPVPGVPQRPQRFLLHELLATVNGSGHNVTHTVFVECHQMYRAEGPPELRSIGETEFVTGIAAMSASGGYGPIRVAHRIVGNVDLRHPALASLLDAHMAVAGERFRGVRMNTAYRTDGLFGFPCDPSLRGILADPEFVAGARRLAAMDLSLDIWCLDGQLGDLAELARSAPGLTIVLDHLGTADRASNGQMPEPSAQWKAAIAALARLPNVFIKIGGLGMDLSGPITDETGAGGSEQVAAEWKPYAMAAIEAFGAGRSMFESNFPPDRAGADYGTMWNAFKLIARNFSDDEKDMLFRGTAAKVYRIE